MAEWFYVLVLTLKIRYYIGRELKYLFQNLVCSFSSKKTIQDSTKIYDSDWGYQSGIVAI